MSSVTVQQLQQDADSVVRRVENGESVVIVRGEQPVAEILPVTVKSGEPRPIGLCAGQFIVPRDFDAPLPEEIIREFEGQ